MARKPGYYEFFAGGGMARAGLGLGWTCLFANDFDARKAETYRANWGGEALHVGDVKAVTPAQLPGRADLVWASFPCQDLSLAGAGAGLRGERSGSFWPFWALMMKLRDEGRAPKTIVLENVCGALTSHGGKDFRSLCEALAESGYRFGALVIDAALFLPQSRPRLFIVAVAGDVAIPATITCETPDGPFYTNSLLAAQEGLSPELKRAWLWWRLPSPPAPNTTFADIVEDSPADVAWHDSAETRRLIGMMSAANFTKFEKAKRAGRKMAGTLYRRTRYEAGKKVQRAEARFDDLAGCLRTPAGGSSRQFVLLVEEGRVRSRLMSARETARLMGLPDDYKLPARYNDAYHLTGDGVVVPVVRHIAAHLVEPLLTARAVRDAA
jgi:DNA (cytosine-5)-methyltransferase 1